jgi:glycosyltransferase involved in cell wall biosynthesis
MPEISALMCVYNGARWIRDSINSVLSQTMNDFEFIIINDGSTDNTASVLRSYNDKRLVIINKKHMGLTESLNTGLSIANGKFIARIDADDICMPNRFFEQYKFLLENPDVGLVGSNAILIDENGKDIGYGVYPVSYEKIVERLRVFRPVFPHSSIFFRKELILSQGGYNSYYTRSQDFDLYLRLSDKCVLAGSNNFLVKLRLNEESLSYGSDDLQLKMGLAGLISYYRREKKMKDFSVAGYNEWLMFIKQVEKWIQTKILEDNGLQRKSSGNVEPLLSKKGF